MRTLVFGLVALLAQVPMSARGAGPDRVAGCAFAFEQTQRLRRQGALQKAHAQAVLCAQPACSELLRRECVTWLRELEDSLPSVVVEGRAADGARVEAARVEIDGAPVAEALDGRAVPVDPGPRRFRLVRPDGTAAERVQVVTEGRRNQQVVIPFAATAPAAPSDDGDGGGMSARRVAAWTLTGVGAAGLGSFAFFALRGLSARRDLDDCKPDCPRSRRAPIERDFLIGDVSLGVAAVACASAVWLWWRGDPGAPARKVDVAIAPTTQVGAAAVVRLRF